MENKKTDNFDRIQFLEKVVSEFINKTTYKSLKTAYDGYALLASRSSDSAQKEEKRKILEKCFALFSDSEFKKKIEEIRADRDPKSDVLFRAITKAIAERVLSDKKRKYDMFDRFSKGQITQGSTKFIPVNGLKSKPFKDFFGNTLTIQKIGSLIYGTQAVSKESIDKYRIEKVLPDSSVQVYEIFSFIDLHLLERNSEYRNTVLGELLSQNNIELSNTSGYVGEIVSTKNSRIQLKVGEQRENSEKFYRYQASENYALIYDPQDLSAVVCHSHEQTLDSPSTPKNVSEKDDTDRS